MTLKPEFEIPSELINPHAKYFMMIQLESLACGTSTPDEVRKSLDAVDYFIMCCGGIHSRIAVSNEYSRVSRLTDEQMIEIARKTFK